MNKKPLPPHLFRFRGQLWRTRWGRRGADPDDDLDPKDEFAATIYSERIIMLHPDLRRTPAKAWESWWHEVFHVFDNSAEERKDAGWWMPHTMMYRLDIPMGELSAENGIYVPCLCAPCQKRLSPCVPASVRPPKS